MQEDMKKGLEEYAEIRYLNPDEIILRKTEGGFLALQIGDSEKYDRVNLYRAFPFSKENEFISVRDSEGKEIGILRSLDDFSGEKRALLLGELNRRYFTPIIERIHSIKEEFGYVYWDVKTDAGYRRFTIKRDENSVINIDGKRVLIIDVDGNRFEIPDVEALDAKSYKKIELLI